MRMSPTLTSNLVSPMLIPLRGVSRVFWKLSLMASILLDERWDLRVNV